VTAMPRLAANISWLFTELPFLERFEAAAAAGFTAIECLFPYDHPAEEISQALAKQKLSIVLFNAPPGNFAAGDRGLAAVPGRQDEFRKSLELALQYAVGLAVPRLHVMSGITAKPDAPLVLRRNLEFALEQTKELALELTLEPINSRDIPGYFLTTLEQTAALIRTIGDPRLKLQLDWYHAQIMGGDLVRRTNTFWDLIGHIQVAGVPERQEPSEGEVNHLCLFDLIDQRGYQGWVGCEYKPKTTTLAGLGWAKKWLGGAERAD
jgi:hydroxypyruvate isomerase